MPWCPKCKNEYREGFTVCSDCNIPLVDKLDAEDNSFTFCYFTSEALHDKFAEYLNYSGIKNSTGVEQDTFWISCDKKDVEKAKKTLIAFANVEKNVVLKSQIDSSIIVISKNENDSAALPDDSDDSFAGKEESENVISDTDSEESEEIQRELQRNILSSKTSSVYSSKKFMAEEKKGSGIILVGIGGFGLILSFLNITEVIHIFQQGFSTVVCSLMFIGMIVIGVLSLKSSKEYEVDSVEEEKLTDYINSWLKSNITGEDVISADDKDLSPEENYLLRIDYIKKRLLNSMPEFTNLDDNYIDSLIEDFYNENIDR